MAYLVLDNIAVSNKDLTSGKVAPEQPRVLSKNVNCQTLVPLTRARTKVLVLLAPRLFLRKN